MSYIPGNDWQPHGILKILILSMLLMKSGKVECYQRFLCDAYFDELLQRLKQKDIGCHIGASFTGALWYAADLSLLCPATRGLQKIISVCSEFAEEYIVVFNQTYLSRCISIPEWGEAWMDWHLQAHWKYHNRWSERWLRYTAKARLLL